jgi:excinuclease UvrABC ATPase subunit
MKYVNMTEALRQVREKAPNTADAMARHKAGNAGFTDKAHLKAKGLIPRSDGTKKVSEQIEVRFQLPKNNHRRNTFKTQSDADKYADAIKKKGGVVTSIQPNSMSKNIDDLGQSLRSLNMSEETCPKCEGEECQCPQSETLEVTNADKMINTTAYQNYKAGDEHYHPAEDLEEQKKQLEEEIAFLSEMKDNMIQEKIQQGFAVRFFDPSNGKRFAAAYPNKKDAQDKAAQLKKDGLKDISITQHTLNFKEENNENV